MSQAAVIMVWGALGIMVYVYLGYPLALWILAQFRCREVHRADITPTVTLLISVYNEAPIIGAKLENCLVLDYPKDRVEVIVISDASSDATDQIVRGFAESGIKLLRMPERGGKTVGLNAAMQVARGEIVVFSDANILYQKDTIRCLVRSFADPSVGCATGDSRYVDQKHSAAHEQEDFYWGYERVVRNLESQVGSTVGGDGAIFAIRRKLYTPLLSETINDLVTPLQIVARGYRAVFDSAAVGFEPSAGDFGREFRRKRRIVNRSWRGLMNLHEVLDPRHVGLFAWQVWSHKVIRWFMLPLVMVVAIGCFAASSMGWEYRIGAWGFIGSLVMAGLGCLMPVNSGRLARLAQGVLYFYLVNFAAFLGITMAIAGRVERIWVPERG